MFTKIFMPLLIIVGIGAIAVVICFVTGCNILDKDTVKTEATATNTNVAADGTVVGITHNTEKHDSAGLSVSPPTPPKATPPSGGAPVSNTTANASALLAKTTNDKVVRDEAVKFNGDLNLTEQAMAYAAIIRAKAEAEASANEWKRLATYVGGATILLITFMICVFPFIYKDLKAGSWHKTEDK